MHALFISFLYKYWYIVLPLALMGVFGGVEEEPPQDTRQGAPHTATAGVTVATPTSGAETPAGQARKRRGKRD